MYEGVLRASANPGRYEVDVHGPDLTAGMVCEVWLGGHWVVGVVRHSTGRADEGGMMAVERPQGVYDGYYLTIADEQGMLSVCGLCTGMYVRLRL
jgi:hypothetical protein